MAEHAEDEHEEPLDDERAGRAEVDEPRLQGQHGPGERPPDVHELALCREMLDVGDGGDDEASKQEEEAVHLPRAQVPRDVGPHG